MYIFFLAIILMGLVIIFFIIRKKIPQLANLDVANLPKEVEARKKREIIAKRIEAQGEKWKAAWQKRLLPLKKWWEGQQLRFRRYVKKIEKLWYHEHAVKHTSVAAPIDTDEQEQKLNLLIQEAEQSLKDGKYDRAEGLFIAAIKLDQKSAAAYRGLGDSYLASGSLEEARQTYRFLLQLEPDDDSVMVKLAEVAESQGDLEEAITYYQQAAVINDSLAPRFYHLAELLLKVKQPETAKEAIVQAVELEPKSPKYLDLLTETAIICGDKDLALSGYNELRLVNPENQKLENFKERMSQL